MVLHADHIDSCLHCDAVVGLVGVRIMVRFRRNPRYLATRLSSHWFATAGGPRLDGGVVPSLVRDAVAILGCDLDRPPRLRVSVAQLVAYRLAASTSALTSHPPNSGDGASNRKTG